MSGKEENHNGCGEKEKMLSDASPVSDDPTDDMKCNLTSEHYEPTEEDLAYKGWKHLIPFRSGSKNPKTLPLISAGPLNFATAHWATSLIYKAYKKGIDETDLFNIPWRDSAAFNSKRFEKHWNEELARHGKEKASVARAIIRMIRARLIFAVFLTFLFSAFAILGPAFFVRRILEIIREDTNKHDWEAAVYAAALVLSLMLRTYSFSSAFIVMYTPGVRVRGGVLSVVFKKILNQQIQNKSVGELVNLCANDGQRLYDACMMGVFALGGLASVAGAGYAVYLLGAWGILGFIVFFLFLPIQMVLSRVIFGLRRKAIPVTDERVKLMSEIVTAIKLVKMYAWEKSFAKKINDIRLREKNFLSRSLMVQSLSSVLPQTVPLFASAFTFIAMTMTGVDLTATQAFVFISLLNSLRFTLGIMPYSMKALAEGRHACDRMKAILIAEEEKMEISSIKDSGNLIEFRDVSFGWNSQPEAVHSKAGGKPGGAPEAKKAANGAAVNGKAKPTKNSTPTPSTKSTSNGKNSSSEQEELVPLAASGGNKQPEIVETLHNINLDLKEGMLLGVCGAVGSGKTSLIQAILGMMKKINGDLAIDESKKIAYVPQQAWIMNTTVRENIIFGHTFDQERYDKVVEACALLSDFEVLAGGDQTEIGERGINLSGGQKQRISIARAVYSDSAIIMLDDPLSAVDAHVGQHIFSNCVKGVLAGKTILFVTHQLQFLTGCDYLLVMKEGKINEEGTHDGLMANTQGEYAQLIKSFHDTEEKEKAKEIDATSVAGSLFSRQQSKMSGYSRQYSVQSDKSQGDVKSKFNASQDKLTNGSLHTPSAGHNVRRRMSHQLEPHANIDMNSNANPSTSQQELHIADFNPEDGDFRNRAVSMHSMRSARKAALAAAHSHRMLDSSMVADGIASGSVMDLGSIVDQEDDPVNLVAAADEDARKLKEGQLTKAEELEQGAVGLSTFRGYGRAAGGCCIVSIVLGLVLTSVSTQAFGNYWLSYWINQGSDNTTKEVPIEGGGINGTQNSTFVISDSLLDHPKLNFFVTVYGCSLIAVVIFTVLKSLTYMKVSLHASSKLHDMIFRKVVASPMSFFDVTPSGQVMNRFSKDMDEIDVNLPFLSEQFLNNATVMLITITIISIVFPYFLIAMVPICIVFILLYKICQRGIRGLKRLDNVTRSPLFSHIATTVQGLSTIRAYKKEEQFHARFNEMQDTNNMALFLFHTAMRWAAVRLDTLSLMVVFATSLFVTFMPSDVIPPAYAALALSYAMNMTGLFQYTMRLAIETEARFTSVERIQKYIDNLESEAPGVIESSRPDSSWPKEGAVTFESVDMRYRDGLPLVLKSVNLSIKPQEKIGIVGRTGSGKSSIGMALFRMMEVSGGTITIDGVDISTIGLEDLRSKLSIIPQDPVLFVGTVRYNLDPFHMYTDDELWDALSKCHVKHTIKALDGQLDANIIENGENFSVGERQLLCMARALLRHSKILLLDEATAAIDTETDSLIQQTIKDAFADCTMLTIAHRLNTVVTSDRILVLDEGKVIEYDTPTKLLADSGSVFAQMMAVQESQKQKAMEGQGTE